MKKEESMTALISCFVRAYHSKNSRYKIYDDFLAEKILTKKEYQDISKNMIKGITFFDPNFTGTDQEKLKHIVNKFLSPTILARSAFCETKLNNEIKLGNKQYLILASGYDTSSYYNNCLLKIFEIDQKNMIINKQNRLDNSQIEHDNVKYLACDFTKDSLSKILLKNNFNVKEKTFCSMLGISYYLTKEEFNKLINDISKLLSLGSTIVFDYQNVSKKNIINKLATKANEKMKASYDFFEIEKLAENNNMLIYEHLTYQDIDKDYFYNYNALNPNDKINALKEINYCLLVKR